ncbi:aminodeoxychorismate synthase component I [Pseudomonas fulva]|jgi:para-aminobenzoate synthetase component 1|uniref:aminodeoxychorismate synthase component I n=1 Tax=Pseudomonas TaxID=286 RepID=UPI000CE99576|nr:MULTISPECIES: aminodeoxychorismate synthase component I [Pseudomonas]MCY4126078.1 aminodeoxychorismate synthase component I [Pseudomonas sp.]MDP9665177.1 para-aminobenzoate synthetase component 1 [Pseudomonas cremoricolorata]AVF55131.1 aminodeoxychorismate synthase, component I [Pseudomonas fulva]MBA1206134.1 aminodeoxychorismate synthase component I [Pseudomonas fulva]MBA1215409.1 aminodeoxychorismate synthase component I [Pseudomonas fulva]
MPTCTLYALPYQPDPAAYFSCLRDAPGAILLDSARPGAERGRFDLISAWPVQHLQVLADETGRAFLQRLRDALAALGPAQLPPESELPFAGGLIGYLSYDFGRRLEHLPTQAVDDLGLPDAQLGVYAWALATDHATRTSQLVFHPSLGSEERERLVHLFEECEPTANGAFKLLAPMTGDLAPEQYHAAFEQVQRYIQAGDCYQINLTQRFRAACQGDPWRAYQALRQACPTPFSGFQQLADGSALLSFSPERFIRVSKGHVETRPIKGTRARGLDAAEDARNAEQLRQSPKDRSENLMIVDLLRNDLGRTCEIGSVKVPELFSLETYPNVHHLVSSVTGTLAADKDALDLIGDSFPGGSITGAPKIRAMQIIDELEPTRRALYCGSLLYVDVRGEMDSSIAIRSLLIKDGQVSCWGGGAVVADSEWQAEYEESIAKVRVLMQTLQAI